MKYHCTAKTDLDELIGHDEADGFYYGPLSLAMKRGEALELEESDLLSAIMRVKLASVVCGVVLVETGEAILPLASFRLVLH
jgi:hypothetical protein